jgi:FkbM family methyltransferase
MGENVRFYIETFEGSLWYGKDRDTSICDTTPELEWARAHTKKGDVFFDIGAHHGYFAILYSKWVGKEGKVYCFECSPSNDRILRKNLEINQATNVIPFWSAVGSEVGQIEIEDNSAGVFLSSKKTNKIKVPLISIDSFLGTAKVLPSILKIDVEGYEWEVLQGCGNLLNKKPKMILEIHNFAHSNPQPRLEKILAVLSHYNQMEWQPSPGEKIIACPSSQKEKLQQFLQYPNPHIYLSS